MKRPARCKACRYEVVPRCGCGARLLLTLDDDGITATCTAKREHALVGPFEASCVCRVHPNARGRIPN